MWTIPQINPVVFWKIIKKNCGLNSGLCYLGGSKNLGPRNWRFSSTVHVFTLPTQNREELAFGLVFYHLSYGLHDVFFLLSRYIPVLKIWDRNKKKTRIWTPTVSGESATRRNQRTTQTKLLTLSKIAKVKMVLKGLTLWHRRPPAIRGARRCNQREWRWSRFPDLLRSLWVQHTTCTNIINVSNIFTSC